MGQSEKANACERFAVYGGQGRYLVKHDGAIGRDGRGNLTSQEFATFGPAAQALTLPRGAAVQALHRVRRAGGSAWLIPAGALA